MTKAKLDWTKINPSELSVASKIMFADWEDSLDTARGLKDTLEAALTLEARKANICTQEEMIKVAVSPWDGSKSYAIAPAPKAKTAPISSNAVGLEALRRKIAGDS